MRTLIFLWLHNQTFYKHLQAKAVQSIEPSHTHKVWADVGCSTGLLTRLAHKLNYTVTGFDINPISIFLAQVLSLNLKNINYKKQDFFTLDSKFDVVSATSLLSVVENKEEALDKLIWLLKDEKSILIIIEPTKKLSIENTWKLIHNFKTLWHYKGLLLWAKARENKAIDMRLFEDKNDIEVTHTYHLDSMVCVSIITLLP